MTHQAIINGCFLAGMTVLPAALFLIGFRILPGEKWQIMGAVPVERRADGTWRGLNLTYYGLFNAIAAAVAVTLLFILLGAVNMSASSTLVLVFAVMALCIPAAKILARWVEGKKNTLTIGGAAFVGFMLLPCGLWAARPVLENHTGSPLSVLTGLSAVSIAYVFGESLGRLACISFGCCYGKELKKMHPMVQRLFKGIGFVFSGKTKKISYAHGLDGRKVFPVQALTSIIYLVTGVAGLCLYLQGLYLWAFLVTVMLSQAWRFLSEFFRADYRGDRRISAYQVMSLVVAAYAVPVALFFSGGESAAPVLIDGFRALWNPLVIFFVQGVCIAAFLFTGRSHVTYADISFHVAENEI